MTTTPSVKRAYIGMSIEEAATIIRTEWLGYLKEEAHKEEHPYFTKAVMRQSFEDAVRDCGWCIAHQSGFKGLTETHDLAIKSLTQKQQCDRLSRIIDHCFNGIDKWVR